MKNSSDMLNCATLLKILCEQTINIRVNLLIIIVGIFVVARLSSNNSSSSKAFFSVMSWKLKWRDTDLTSAWRLEIFIFHNIDSTRSIIIIRKEPCETTIATAGRRLTRCWHQTNKQTHAVKWKSRMKNHIRISFIIVTLILISEKNSKFNFHPSLFTRRQFLFLGRSHLKQERWETSKKEFQNH